MRPGNWIVWHREWLRYKVARCVYSNALGSDYMYARENGRVQRFWTRAAAQAYANRLNAAEARIK